MENVCFEFGGEESIRVAKLYNAIIVRITYVN